MCVRPVRPEDLIYPVRREPGGSEPLEHCPFQRYMKLKKNPHKCKGKMFVLAHDNGVLAGLAKIIARAISAIVKLDCFAVYYFAFYIHHQDIKAKNKTTGNIDKRR